MSVLFLKVSKFTFKLSSYIYLYESKTTKPLIARPLSGGPNCAWHLRLNETEAEYRRMLTEAERVSVFLRRFGCSFSLQNLLMT